MYQRRELVDRAPSFLFSVRANLDRDGGFNAMFGHFLLKCNRIEEAILATRRAVELDPGNPHICELLGNLLIRAGDAAAAPVSADDVSRARSALRGRTD